MNTFEYLGTPKTAAEMMTKKLVTISPKANVADGIGLLLKSGHSGIPVIDDQGTYLGMFSEKCCMKILAKTTELIGEAGRQPLEAKDFMVTRLFTLRPNQDVFDAIGLLLKNRISGAPVTDDKNCFQGMFSEKTSMSVLIQGAYEGLPSTEVSGFMNLDRGRLIEPSTGLMDVTRIFIDTPYRRLPVVQRDRVVGQITRGDVLRNSRILQAIVKYQSNLADTPSTAPGTDSVIIMEAHEQLPSSELGSFMDTQARTIDDHLDLLGIAQIFLNSPYRRLPVLKDGKLIGQVSRRDVLTTAYDLIAPAKTSDSSILFLSAVKNREDMPQV